MFIPLDQQVSTGPRMTAATHSGGVGVAAGWREPSRASAPTGCTSTSGLRRAGRRCGSCARCPVWAQAARVEAMRAARRAAVAEADGEATDDEEEDELPLGCI